MQWGAITLGVGMIALTACQANNPTTGARSAALTSTSCLDPVSYGATPNDDVSDRTAIQAALDVAGAGPEGGTVCLDGGRWMLERAPLGSYNRFGALSIRGRHVTLRGAGPETVLAIAGDQGASTTIAVDILPGAAHVRVADLALDLSGTTNTSEQTHAIATSGTCAGEACQPIEDVLIERVTFRHPRNTSTRKGDCVRLLGNSEATRLRGVRIVNNDFEQCARSSVTIQRGVYETYIGLNRMAATKTCVDGEATGGPSDMDARLTITGNVFRAGCAPSISLTSYTGATITGNTIDGAITVYRSKQVAISANAIEHTATSNAGTIDVANVCDGLSLTGNTITRNGVPGPVLKLEPHSGAVCSGAAITGNTVYQGTAFHAAYLESVSRLAIGTNVITFTVPAPSMSAIYERAVMAAAPVTAVAITGNVITGPATYAVTLQAHPAQFGPGVVLTGNTAVGPTFGLYAKDANYTAPIVSAGNAWPGGSWPIDMVTAGSR